MKKRILFLMTSMGGGGTEKVLVTLLQNFDKIKYDVSLCLISRDGIYINDVSKDVNLIWVYNSPSSLIAKIGFVLYSRYRISLIERLAIRSKIRGHYDTIVSFCEGRTLKFHSYVFDKARNNISWVHADIFSDHYTIGPVLSAKDERRFYEAMDNIVFVSKGAQSQFLKLGYTLKRTTVIYNPIDIPRIKIYKSSFSSKTDYSLIVLCGRLCKVKGYDRMIRIASRLISEGIKIKVNIIGEGEERNNLLTLISDLALSEYVSLLGFMNPPFSEMAKADLFVSSSINEGFGMNLCEALCLGLPIVATRCSGTTEILGENNEFGLIAENNEKSLYECISRILKDKELQLAYRKKSKRAISRFDIRQAMKDIYSVL